MSPDDPSLQPVIVLRVVIRSPDLDTFVSKYSRFVKDDRIFIFTKSSQPQGTRVRFTLELADGQPLLFGEGTVTRTRPDSGDPSKPPGMELKFVPLDESSRELLARMLHARDSGTGQLSVVTDVPSPLPSGRGSQFRDETTDARTNIRDGSTSSALPSREFEESPPTLPPLAKTGAQQIIKAAAAPTRQDESGAVTLAQAPPGEHVDAPSPSLPVPILPPPPPIPTGASKDDKHSGGFSTPTPLPAPIPAAPEEFGGSPPPTKLARPSQSDAVTTGVPAVDNEHAFVAAGPAPAFAEAFRSPIPGVATPPAGASRADGKTVPANPFSEVSDGAIEYFVEWSLEQSTAPKPKVAEAHFANVVMATPRAEKRRSMRGPLLSGIAIGIFLGLPLGGAIVWFGRPLPAPVIVEKMPEVGTPRPIVAPDDLALARAETPDLAIAALPSAVAVKPAKPSGATVKPPKPSSVAVKPTGAPVEPSAVAVKPTAVAVKPSAESVKPSAVAVKPTGETTKPSGAAMVKPTGDSDTNEKPEKASKPSKEDGAELAIVTHPSGAAVSIDGEVRGKTPLTLSLPAGAHEISVARDRYATITQPVEVPAKLELTLKRPTATLHVDSEPAGGEVVVEGKPRGKTPVDVTLEAFHHYDVSVMLLGTKPWHKRVSLKPPQVNVTATLSVVHSP